MIDRYIYIYMQHIVPVSSRWSLYNFLFLFSFSCMGTDRSRTSQAPQVIKKIRINFFSICSVLSSQCFFVVKNSVQMIESDSMPHCNRVVNSITCACSWRTPECDLWECHGADNSLIRSSPEQNPCRKVLSLGFGPLEPPPRARLLSSFRRIGQPQEGAEIWQGNNSYWLHFVAENTWTLSSSPPYGIFNI